MKIYQIQVALKGSKPKIWRRLLVPSTVTLPELHQVIQIAMGWSNTHLYQFIKNCMFYLERMEDNDFWDEMDNVDCTDVKVSDLLKREKDKIVYEYDFGDSWEHNVILEKVLPVDSAIKYPVCLTGRMSCPPEDCGGIWGYAQMLEVLQDPKHEEYDRCKEWLGGDFDPKYFNKDEVNGWFSAILH
ncbi:plasmid pRiA4b ORF-3 family protein [Marinilabiliaceae bacterium JC017]|nr:plasmid pRiA4b ORF-3 family protein [Marinilabiliaceae bacterium JC017]